MEFNDFWALVVKKAPTAPSVEFDKFYFLIKLAYEAKTSDIDRIKSKIREYDKTYSSER